MEAFKRQVGYPATPHRLQPAGDHSQGLVDHIGQDINELCASPTKEAIDFAAGQRGIDVVDRFARQLEDPFTKRAGTLLSALSDFVLR